MAPGDDQPATKGDLRELGARFRGDLATKNDLRELEARLTLEIGKAVNAVAEIIGSNARVVDERYKDLPGRVSAMEQRLEEHAGDARLHRRPPPSAPKRGSTKRR